MMGEEEIPCDFLLTEQHSNQADGLFLFGYSPSICNPACNSWKVDPSQVQFIRCLKNSGCF